MTHKKQQKLISSTQGLYIIRTAHYIRGLELMKLIFAVLDVSLMMGLTRCYKTEGFFTFIFQWWLALLQSTTGTPAEYKTICGRVLVDHEQSCATQLGN